MNPTNDGHPGSNGVAQGAEPGGDARLTQALEEYRALLEAGPAPDRAAFLARHPEMAEELAECLSGLEFVHAVAPALSGAAAEGAAAEDRGVDWEWGAALGDFRILREVGRGGMGIVYEAEQISLGRRVALKVLPFAATMDPRHLQRFHNEARAAAGLHHTNIVPVYAVGCERGVHFYTMQFIDGRTLADFIAQQRHEAVRQMPTTAEAAAPSATTAPPAARATSAAPRDAAYFRRVAEWGIQAAEALDCAHALGVVHRDVKPANLLVDAADRLWVTDFGLAQIQSDARLTMTGDLVGTLRYMSPEQALAQRVVIDHRTDVYSLGATLYELLALQPAFEGTDRQELLRQIAFEEPRAPRRVNKAVPAELETIVLKALEKNPADRYTTAQELAADLRRWLEDRPIRARRASVLQRLRKLARRHRPAVAASAVCLLVTLVALGGGGGWVLNDQAARRREAGAKAREAEGKVEEALEAANPGLRDGNPADLVLLAAAQRIEAQLGSGAVGPEVRRRGEQLLRDVRVLAALDEARLSRTEGRYEAAFRMYGIDVLALDQPKAAARIRASAIREALLAGLDAWLEIMPKDDRQHLREVADAERADLRRLADAADDNAWRRAFREAALAADNDKLKALAGQPEALAQPPAVLDRLASVLMARNLRGEALAVWRQAQQRHPADFWINYNLGHALHSPPGEPSGKEFVLSNTEALSYCRAAVAIRPSSAEALRLLGAVLVVTGDLDAALVACQQSHALYPRGSDPEHPPTEVAELAATEVMLGDALGRRGRWDEAVACYKKSLELDLSDPQHHRKLREVLKEQGKLDEAVAFYEESLELDLVHLQLHPMLLEVLKEQGKLDEAIAFDKKLIELHPHESTPRLLLGDALKELGKLDEAIAEYQEAIRLDPTDGRGHQHLGFLLLEQSRDKEAEAEAREAVRLRPDDVSRNLLGNTRFKQGRYKDAEAEYREFIRLQPYLHAARNLLGLALGEQGRHKEAEAEYREAIRLKPDESVYHNNLGFALYQQGRSKEAEAEYREAIRLKPDNPVMHDNLGDILSNQGQHEKAAAAFNEAVRLQPGNGWYWVRRGWAYADLGQWEKASADFVKATECQQPNVWAWYSRAMLCLRDGDRDGYRKICADMLQRFGKGDDADSAGQLSWTCVLVADAGVDPAQLVSLAEKASEKAPKDHWNVNLLGATLYRAGRFEEAVKRLTEATALNPDPYRTNMLYTWFFLALAHQRLGHADEARRWLDKAIQATDEALKTAGGSPEESGIAPGTIPPNWKRKLTLQLLRREAEELIPVPGTKPAK